MRCVFFYCVLLYCSTLSFHLTWTFGDDPFTHIHNPRITVLVTFDVTKNFLDLLISLILRHTCRPEATLKWGGICKVNFPAALAVYSVLLLLQTAATAKLLSSRRVYNRVRKMSLATPILYFSTIKMSPYHF
jgi:hypothetical protein